MSNSDIEQAGTVKGHIPNGASLSGRISNVVSLSGHISIGSGASDFIIKMTVTSDDNGNYTVTSCDATVEQIDAAVAAEKRVVLIATDTTSGGFWEMPLVQAFHGETYIFMAYTFSGYVMSTVYKYGENETWEFVESGISSESIDYYDSTQQTVINVKAALDNLVPKSHTHSNKAVLDKFAETDGKPTYNGEKISGASTAEEVEYTNAILPDASNVKSALDDTIDTLQTQSADTESLRAGVSALIDAYETQGEDIASLKTQAHTHANKLVLDKFAETDGKPTYNGEALGGGSGDFIIKMTVESNGSELIVTSCDTTVEQIDEAVAAEKRVVLIASIDSTILELPMIQGDQGYSYYFGALLSESVLFSTVYKTENTSSWAFAMIQIWAGAVEYSNDALPNVTDVESALNELVPKSHTHANKDTLDKLSDSNGKLQYNSSDILTKSDKQEIIDDVLAALPAWTGGNY